MSKAITLERIRECGPPGGPATVHIVNSGSEYMLSLAFTHTADGRPWTTQTFVLLCKKGIKALLDGLRMMQEDQSNQVKLIQNLRDLETPQVGTLIFSGKQPERAGILLYSRPTRRSRERHHFAITNVQAQLLEHQALQALQRALCKKVEA